jgi:hypothetical protein
MNYMSSVERAHAGIETQFRADNQPKQRGRPRGSPDEMPRALKETLSRLPRSWDASKSIAIVYRSFRQVVI